MPKPDKAPSATSLRRTEVIACAAKLLVEKGLGEITFRNLARSIGCSTTVITHHFRNKEEVLLETYRHVNARAAAMRDAALAGHDHSVVRAMEELLPIGDAQRENWAAWIHVWSAALHNPTLGVEHAKAWQQTVDRVVLCLRSSGLAQDAAEFAAQTICTAMYGIAVQALFAPERWSRERVIREYRRMTSSLP